MMETIEDIVHQESYPFIPNIDQYIDDYIKSNEQVLILIGPPGTGKAQPLDAEIITPDGVRLMGDIKEGDQVMNPNGGSSIVLGVFPQGMKEVYRVIFSDGSSTECCMDHLWSTTKRSNRQKNKPKKFEVSPLKQIGETLKTNNGGSNHSIPITSPINFPKKSLELDPYSMGLLLGDGSFRKYTVNFSSKDTELIEHLGGNLPPTVRMVPKSDHEYMLTVKDGKGRRNPLNELIRGFELNGKYSYEKHIPECYLFSSIEDRIALLQGLMDTDGYVNKGRAGFSTTSKIMAEQFQFLVESLGGITRLRERQPAYIYYGERRVGRNSFRFHLCLPPNIIPFRLKRKAERYAPNVKYLPRRIIRCIEYVGTKQTQCISIDSADGLYLTNHCIVTHNTRFLRYFLKKLHDHVKPMVMTKDWDDIPTIDEDKYITVSYTTDKNVIESDHIFIDLFSDSVNCLILEDIDFNLRARKEGNTAMYKLLAASDGLITNSNRKIIVSTNLENENRIDSAFIRPGRCFDILKFRPLDLEESNLLLGKWGITKELTKDDYTLGELYRIKNTFE
jgi:SpoVK/Ycf46/Vps4 family AAA+-type ATPase